MNDRTRRRKRRRFIRKLISQSLVVSIIVIILLLGNNAILKTEEVRGIEQSDELKSHIEEQIWLHKMALENAKIPPEYNITLSKDLQEYTYQLIEKCSDVDYETVLAVLYTESKFDANAKNVNRNGSIDRGIAQINSDYTEHYAEVSGYYGEFDPYIAEHGIRACVYKLQTLADVWKNQGVTNKDTLELYTIQSYHMGVIGFKNYKSEYGSESKYSKIILERKNELLQKGELS